MNVVAVITAHTSRLEEAGRLCSQVGADCMFIDDGTLGEPGNTRQALRWAETQHASHVLLLQDDALPVDGFLELAHAAITERPNHLISYYLGTGRPSADHFAQIVEQASTVGARWIDTNRLYWGVAWSIPTACLANLNEWLAAKPATPTDTEVGHWAKFSHTPCAHTWPSLVDHADGPSLIHNGTGRRKAWRVTPGQLPLGDFPGTTPIGPSGSPVQGVGMNVEKTERGVRPYAGECRDGRGWGDSPGMGSHGLLRHRAASLSVKGFFDD